MDVVSPDATLLTACDQFNRLNATLAATRDDDDPGLDVAWQARQAVVDRLVPIRPVTDAGRGAKAAVGLAIMSEVEAWRRDGEVLSAWAAFRAEWQV